MWLIAEYQPVGLFSLKSALATSSGGKSLIVPTPFAIKMALLDAAYRVRGVQHVEGLWPPIRALSVAIALPDCVVVTNLFTKILKPRRGDPPEGIADAGPLQKSIGFREYVWPTGSWRLALGTEENDAQDWLSPLLLQINYLGKRGSFLQLLPPLETVEILPDTFTSLNPQDGQATFDSQGVLQVLDDCGPKMTLEHANIYSGKRITMGRQRVLHHVVLPYRQVQSSKSYTLYKRLSSEISI